MPPKPRRSAELLALKGASLPGLEKGGDGTGAHATGPNVVAAIVGNVEQDHLRRGARRAELGELPDLLARPAGLRGVEE